MNVIHQTSNALNKCCHDMSVFAGSAEAVECNRLLLVACKKREAYLIEMQKLKENPNYQKVMVTSRRGGGGTSLLGPQGRLTISDIRLPIKGDFLNKLGTIQDTTTHYFLIMIRHETHIMFTQMTSTHDGQLYGCSKNRGRRDYLEFPNLININNVGQDFDIVVEIYGMVVSPSDPINSPRKKTPKKTGLLNLTPRSSRRYETSSGVGSAATTAASVRSTNFIQLASIKLNRSHVSLSAFALERIPQSCPIQNCIMMNLKCMMENVIERKDFLTMFEDVSGLGAWHRRWFSLKNGVLSYWKYPDDELYKEPLGTVDLKTCITASVGLVTREVCARPNTFEIETMRNKRRGDRNTLIQTCNDKLASITTKHWLSADTKEDRESWCRSLNEALVNLRAWHADAMRPISKWPQ
ncbi:hypothetical protein HELRODRAFT_95214 [Helobdella robusta]|uniref:PH domain-containing protein n=1 Tax=Helobdella robusta TaxID=6412 RepID=T1G951_HELRO|nr:hypothetical protein HELRODRAFT_95214 [Helobdella robusta]ESN96052.1 hypothetical protein HELRODRAFT_95214 [Helobdella robusta]